MHKIYGKWLHNQLVISELPGASISKRILVQKLSFENEFDLHENERVGETHFQVYRAFSHDVTAAILVYQNNETAAMLVYQTNPVRIQIFSCALRIFKVNQHLLKF